MKGKKFVDKNNAEFSGESKIAKKSLGQNFLKSESALRKIIETSNIQPNSGANDFVLEIGPGRGALTEYLLAAGATVTAIEADFEMIKFLQEKFATEISTGKLKLIHDDILKFDIEKFGKEISLDETSASKNYKLIANIPYYITGEIIRKFLSAENQPSQIILLVQKEVADRIVARSEKSGENGKESILSISVKVYCEPKFIQTVKAGSFVPAPKVDSAIISFSSISKKNFARLSDEKKFFDILHAGFAHKRKMLFSNLKEKLNLSTEQIEKIIAETKLDKNIRAENLSVDDWLKISAIL